MSRKRILALVMVMGALPALTGDRAQDERDVLRAEKALAAIGSSDA